jgi:polyisoprenyl-teichoic acid--peptidoglycan teichoic acid transferase
MAGGSYAYQRAVPQRVPPRRPAALANGSQRALFAFAVLTLFLASSYSGIALLARVTPALFPGRSLRNVPVVAAIDKVAPVSGPSETSALTDPIQILVLGLDRRPEYDRDGNLLPLPDGKEAAALTDVIMVIRIDPLTKKSTMLSFPRDMWIETHREGHEPYYDRINVSFEMGVLDGGDRAAGIDQVKRDMRENFGIEIDHAVVLDFKGVEGLVDAIGGINVDVPGDLAIYNWPYSDDDRTVQYVSFPPGINNMDGYHAVAFGRNREGDSDLYRIQRQQLVIKAAIDKTFSSGFIGRNPLDLWDAYGDLVKTDIPTSELLGLADLVRRTNGSMVSYSLGDPVDDVPTMIPYTVPETGAAVLQWNPENVQYWLSRAFPATRYADAVVELQNGYGRGEQGATRTTALGKYLVYSRGLVTVYYGDDVPAQPHTVVMLHRADQRKAAEDIAGWLSLPKNAVRDDFVPSDNTLSPDITVVVGQDFVIPGTR